MHSFETNATSLTLYLSLNIITIDTAETSK